VWSEYPIHSDMCQRGNERIAELEAQLAAAEAERDALRDAAEAFHEDGDARAKSADTLRQEVRRLRQENDELYAAFDTQSRETVRVARERDAMAAALRAVYWRVSAAGAVLTEQAEVFDAALREGGDGA